MMTPIFSTPPTLGNRSKKLRDTHTASLSMAHTSQAALV